MLRVIAGFFFCYFPYSAEKRGELTKFANVVSLVILTSLNKDVALLNGNVQTYNFFWACIYLAFKYFIFSSTSHYRILDNSRTGEGIQRQYISINFF